jgi:hypothetical protein
MKYAHIVCALAQFVLILLEVAGNFLASHSRYVEFNGRLIVKAGG